MRMQQGSSGLQHSTGVGRMNDSDRPKRETMSLEEATISNMWEIAALVEVLEKKGLCTKQELFDIRKKKKGPGSFLSKITFSRLGSWTASDRTGDLDLQTERCLHDFDELQAGKCS